MNGIFDSHAHYDDERFDADRDELLQRIHREGVEYIMTIGSDLASSRAACRLAERYDFIWFAAGIHPEQAGDAPADYREALKELAAHPKCRAIGEIGLDYYWAENPPRDFQQMVFRKQLALAEELELPVIVHDREAHGDSLSIIREFPAVTGVFHCFSGSPEMAEELLKRGWYLGFDGPITYKNARRAPEVAAITPLERMVVETDAPYLSPAPVRGRRNDSRYLPHVIAKLAEWKGVTPEEMTRITCENGKRLFRLG